MPDQPAAKSHPHPWKQRPAPTPHTAPAVIDPAPPYAELQVTTNFTFLTGASHPEEFVHQADALACRAVAVTDINTLGGIVRAHIAAREANVRFITGCRLQLRLPARENHSLADASRSDHPALLSLLVYPTDRASYGRLCDLLTLGKRRAEKGECHLDAHDLLDHHHGLLAVAIPPEVLDDHFISLLRWLRDLFDDDRLSLAACRLYTGDDERRLRQLDDLSRHVEVPLVTVNDVLYHAPDRRALQDVLTCIRLGCTLSEAGLDLQANSERHLKPPDEMHRLFADYPRALARTIDIAQRAAGFDLDQLRYEYADETCPPDMTPMMYLKHLVNTNLQTCDPPPTRCITQQIEHEFQLIDELNYAPYFLTVYDLVQFARKRGILCQGRGAAANSAVCYYLGITAVDPARIDLLFERFVSKERNEPPDIDIDFEHERREEVIQYIYEKYGRDRAALCAEVVTYRGRSAVREVGKALDLSLDCVDRLAKNMDWWDKGGARADRLREIGINPDDPTIRQLITLTGQILGFPRHRSQHVGGFVITRGPLRESVPIENAAMPDRTVIEWDKDDIDAMGMLKVDCLGLGMLSCIAKALKMINEQRPSPIPLPLREGSGEGRGDIVRDRTENIDQLATANTQPSPSPSLKGRGGCNTSRHLTFNNIPPEDPRVYDMICDADTIGVFQIESRAQMSMLPRLKPRNYYDLVIEVAIVRPGPIVGDMVHPYLRRRNGEEPPVYPTPMVEQILGKTLGVPLFQEQAMSLAIHCSGFTPGEADQLRRAIAAWKSKDKVIFRFGEKIKAGMVANGYDLAFAEQCFEQIKGFSEYGFPESHAASFALIVYVSAWIKCYYPAVFAAALINSQPMGFYAPAQIVRDARMHGVVALPIDVNCSTWDCTVETDGRWGGHPARRWAEGPNVDDKSRLRRDGGQDARPTNHLRLGMRLVKGLGEDDANAIAQAVQTHGPFDAIEPLWRTASVSVATLRKLAQADAFNSMGLDRQHALWHIRTLRDERLPLFESESA